MGMTIVDYGNEYHINWDYDPLFHKHYLDSVKGIGITTEYEAWELGQKVKKTKFQRTAYFEQKKKYWVVEKSSATDDQVLNLQITCRANILVPAEMAPEKTGAIPPMRLLQVDVPIKGTFREYQKTGVQRGLDFKNFVNGDEMGLGKSLEAIGTVLAADCFPCLVVCPSSVKINWQREWHQWSGRKAIIMEDSIKDNWAQYYSQGGVDVFIVNYESLKKYFAHYIPPKDKKTKEYGKARDIVLHPMVKMFKSIIIDELHRCKDSKTLRSKLTMAISNGRQLRIGLTGTLFVNRIKEMYPQLAIVGAHKHFGDGTEKYFLNRYCEGGNGSSNLAELKYILYSKCYFSRNKKDVAKELPPKIRQSIACDISTREEYNKAKSDFKRYLESTGMSNDAILKSLRGEVMVQMQKLKAISARGKMEAVKEWVEDIVEQGKKVVLFANLHEIMDKVVAMFPGITVKISGEDNVHVRQTKIDAFQNDPHIKIAVVSIKAGGVGLNFTAGHNVGFIEYPYHPADCKQCEDRCHRLTTTETVFVNYFLGLNTIDERSYEIIRDKADISTEIFGEQERMEMTVITDFLKAIRA